MKLTRRELALAAVAPAIAKSAPQADNEKPSAEDAQKRIAEIRKFKAPAETEPAFSFRAQ